MTLTTDHFYHNGQHSTFEGWYLKHQTGNRVYAFIPGIAIGKAGVKNPFIQIITDNDSHVIYYDEEEFTASADRFYVKIGQNIFSEQGMCLAIEDPNSNLKIQGAITYGSFTPLAKSRYAPSIMGPFSYAWFLECYHGILSMGHALDGSLQWNDQRIDFVGGTGYIEKDWGVSFPKSYIWAQSNQFDNEDVRFFFSMADIPFLGFAFLGLISVLQIGGQEYRFATYRGGKVTTVERNENGLTIKLKQRALRLTLTIQSDEGKPLMAPIQGGMERVIRESANTHLFVSLTENGKLLYEGDGRLAGFEEVGVVRGFNY